ncbi:MAG TPA: bifunctional UDP-N-acetylglucosamine diphosphorylase/glucosamine-1-phosphate N-acetyltransferase GlmU [Solirubrobacteraceae bacterium]|nr:bifunctional UDP-N-acetylglucosamine diphosphorylase/glucosamine-1-phosphate N-acetyltransferase GlmU [Solirubrobacteraceae bacterium]
MNAPTVVIMAAGKGTRMRSRVPKVLHDLCGRPLGLWPVHAALEAEAAKIVVVGGPDRALEGHLPGGVVLAVQEVADGTGGAVRAAAAHFADADGPVIVLSGDVPLITAAAIQALAAAHVASTAAATLLTTELPRPAGYGRVVRAPDQTVERVVETKAPGDATPQELGIREVNAGIYAFNPAVLSAALEKLTTDNAQGELYLPDVVPALRGAGHAIAAHRVDEVALTMGVNDRVQLAQVRVVLQERILEQLSLDGVTFIDFSSVSVDATVRLGPDTVVEPGCVLRGTTTAGEACHLGPHSTLIDARLGDEVTVVHSHLVECELRDRVSVGPFAYLRPGALLREGAKAGTFVEIKNSDVGEGAKVPHLSYVGDADVGARSNLGAATITANYDGRRKHRTTIGTGVRTSVDTTLVAPVELGDGAYTAAGSVITDDVPPGALGVARERQRNVEGYAQRRERESSK